MRTPRFITGDFIAVEDWNLFKRGDLIYVSVVSTHEGYTGHYYNCNLTLKEDKLIGTTTYEITLDEKDLEDLFNKITRANSTTKTLYGS